MKRIVLEACAALLTLSCAVTAQDIPAAPASTSAPDNTHAPACHCQSQCSAMWAQATKDVENASGMRLRIATDALLETYVSRRADRLTGTVTKTPIADGSYRIELALEPSYPGQADVQGAIRTDVSLFNKHLNDIAAATQCPAP